MCFYSIFFTSFYGHLSYPSYVLLLTWFFWTLLAFDLIMLDCFLLMNIYIYIYIYVCCDYTCICNRFPVLLINQMFCHVFCSIYFYWATSLSLHTCSLGAFLVIRFVYTPHARFSCLVYRRYCSKYSNLLNAAHFKWSKRLRSIYNTSIFLCHFVRKQRLINYWS